MVAAFSWKVPKKEFSFMKMEKYSVVFVAIVILFFVWIQVNSSFYGILFAAIFLAIYVLVAYFVQNIRQVQVAYRITPTHFEYHKKSRFGNSKEKVSLKRIKMHKIDHFLLGGYLLTNAKKYVLFFNDKFESKKAAKLLK